MYDESTFSRLYDPPYNRAFYERNQTMYRNRALALQRLGMTSDATVIVIGCGLGFLMRHLIADIGCLQSKVWGIDTSPHIHTIKTIDGHVETRLQIVNADIEQATIRTVLQSLCGIARFDWVVTEDMLPSYATSERVQLLLDACDVIKVNRGAVAHIVSTLQVGYSQDDSQWWRTIEDWQAERPEHLWIDAHNLGGA